MESVLQDFLERKGLHLKVGTRSFVTDCINPSCSKEGHMYIRRSSGSSICYKCVTKWDWRGLVSALDHCKREEAWGVLFGSGGGGDTETQDERAFDVGHEDDVFGGLGGGAQEAPPIHFLGPDFVPVEKSERGLEYLARRGVTDPQAIVDFDIRWHGAMQAVVFPIRRNGLLYGWQARRVDPQEGQLRLMSFGGMSKSRHLLNYDAASKLDNMFVVEGPFDCIKPAMAGFGGVATLGKQVSLDQIKMIMDSKCTRVYNGLDPDAFQEIYELNARMGLGKRIFRVRPPEGREDFGECTPEEVKLAVENAQEVCGPSDMLEVYFAG